MDPDITVRVALDSDPDDPAPVWTDITSRVHYGAGGQPVTVTIGRQDELAEVKPTEMSWALKNADNLFTPRNPTSPYAGKWEQGRRCNIQETVDGETFDLGTGFLSIPDMPIVDPRSSQPVVVTAVDRLGRLDDAPAFEGTLAEHIRAEGTDLVEWFPLTDTYPHMSTLTASVTARNVNGFGSPDLADPTELIRAADVAGPPGDDQSYARWTPISDGILPLIRAHLLAPVQIATGPTDVIALSAWTYRESDPDGWERQTTIASIADGLTSALVLSDATTQIQTTIAKSGVFTTIGGGRPLERDVWRLVTVRLDCATGAVNLWVGADLAVSGSVAAGALTTLTTMTIGASWGGGLGHVQVYVGDSSTMTRADHLAQHRHGYRGLHRQTVAERIVTLARYAGLPATEVDVPAACSTPMQTARLAGVNPAAAMRAAAETGQDLLLTGGQGRITAVPRSQRYNQQVALQIPWGWIGYRGLKYRPDRPVTDVTVQRTGGGTVRRSDRALASRYGVASQRYELDTAIDADPGNLASWAATAFSQMRTRCPSLRINMLSRSLAERKALLGLRVGDRIEITGLPPGSPEDVPHLIVQGIQHTIGPGRIREIQLNTSPLLGPTPGDPPYCPAVGDLVSPTAIIAY